MSDSRAFLRAHLIFVVGFSLLVGLASRIVFRFLGPEAIDLFAMVRGVARGVLFDFTVGVVAFAPILLLSLLPALIWRRGWQKLLGPLTMLVTFIVGFVALGEVFFVLEFGARYNFIAVDYLVYTNEVLENIWQSYPVVTVLAVLGSIHGFIYWRGIRLAESVADRWPAGRKSDFSLSLLAIFSLGLSQAQILDGVAPAEAELSKNPLYALFAAYRSNEIDYDTFYATMPIERAQAITQAHLPREIKASGPARKLNVVIVLMESMSAHFMRSYGSQENLTPNLDRLAQEGIFFDRLYATGTRTVRGIEAVTLSLPPTPGQSIVRRPESGRFQSIGSVFAEKGYRTQFIYGGRAYFDNMKNFFQAHDFDVLDQTNIPKSQVRFANAWGVSDEDLFSFAIQQADAAAEKPFFQLILTTSNHRPYTFPEGRIDLASGSGRKGAVKYADFAIGRYLESARMKPWYSNTVFVFVADHDAAVAGGTRILPSDYRIPLIIYSPEHFPPQRISRLASQIDLAPTLFGLLNFSYQSEFFGQNLFHANPERAFLATYQQVGLWRGSEMAILSPKKRVAVFAVTDETPTLKGEFQGVSNSGPEFPIVEETMAVYQTASAWYKSRKLQ